MNHIKVIQKSMEVQVAKTILKHEVTSQGPFMTLLGLLSRKGLQVIETKDKGEIAITVRVPPLTADRLETYAKASRISRSFLIRMLIEGALDEMDDLVIQEDERQEEENELMSAQFDEIDKEKKEKENRAKALLVKMAG
jgi:predicted DNA-binding protein